jgi:putative tryptophan/tyrosine transport system substrate-binding protein
MQFGQVKRREFISLLGATAAWPTAARTQPSGKTYRIGFLGATSLAESKRRVDGFRTGLRRFGYEEGKNIVILYRWAEGRYERLRELAAELAEVNVDVLVTHGTPGSLAAKEATSNIPIVMAAVGDPVEAGLVASLARPGGNLTGLTFFFTEICAKRAELIKEAIPRLTRLGVLVNPGNPAHPIALAAMRPTASALGVELVPAEVKAREDISTAIASVVRRQLPALVVIDDGLLISNATYIADLALQNRLPMIGFKPQAEAGALLEYGVDLADLFSRSAVLVDKILKGSRPADLPIERAVKFEIIVNLKTAKALGIELPTSLLIRADEVIE